MLQDILLLGVGHTTFVRQRLSNLARRNSPNLAQIVRLIVILLSGKFQENRILGSDSNYSPKNLILNSDKSRCRTRVARTLSRFYVYIVDVWVDDGINEISVSCLLMLMFTRN